MRETPSSDNHVERTRHISASLKDSFDGLFRITNQETLLREKGYYGVLYARPTKSTRTILSVDREVLVLVSTFDDQQPRTIQTAKEIIATSGGRLEARTFIVVHLDQRGNTKLKTWGREQNFTVLPICVASADVQKNKR